MQFDIVANDKASPAMSKVEGSMGKFTTAAAARFAKLAATAAVVVASFRKVFDVMNQIGDISDEAEKLGLSTEKFQRTKHAAEAYGATIEQVATALKDVNKLLDEAANKKGPQMDVLRALQFSDAEITGRQIQAEEVFKRISEAIKEARTEEEKFAIASRIVGDRVAQSMVPILANYDEFNRKAQGVKIVTEDNVQAADEFGQMWNDATETLKNQAANAAMNLLRMMDIVPAKAEKAADTRTPEQIAEARRRRDLLLAAGAKEEKVVDSKMATTTLQEIGGGLARGPGLAITLAERTAVATERTADVLTKTPASASPGSTDITKGGGSAVEAAGKVIWSTPDILKSGFGAAAEEGRRSARAMR